MRQAKLSRMVFGGTSGTDLTVSWVLARKAPVRVTVTKGASKKVLARFAVKRSKAAKVVRRTVKRQGLSRGIYKVVVVAGKGKSARRSTMWSRRL